MSPASRSLLCLFCVLTLVPTGAAGASGSGGGGIETIVLLRHGEKPDDGLGQLNCQGLNRALALPKVIASLFGKPDAIFAPDPARTKPDHIRSYDYVRPLATIEPTAIRFGLPVHTQFGWSDHKGLVAELERSEYRDATLVVAWEHLELVEIARGLLADNHGDPKQVPDWPHGDFDGLFVVRIERDANGIRATFEAKRQHLDDQSKTCPGEA